MHTTYTLNLDAFEAGGRSDKFALEMHVEFDVPFSPGLDVPTLHTEGISALCWEMYDRENNRTLGGGRFKPTDPAALNWAQTFREMLCEDAGLYGELQRYCHDHAGDEADERGHQIRKSQGLDAA